MNFGTGSGYKSLVGRSFDTQQQDVKILSRLFGRRVTGPVDGRYDRDDDELARWSGPVPPVDATAVPDEPLAAAGV